MQLGCVLSHIGSRQPGEHWIRDSSHEWHQDRQARAGAIYDLVACKKNVGRELGQWNTIEVMCQGPKIQVKINNEQVSTINCDEFDQPGVCPDGEKHKFKLDGKPRAVKDFARTGYLGLQDHGHKVWYKNIKLLELKADSK